MIGYAGLCSKLYTCLIEMSEELKKKMKKPKDYDELKKAKGVRKCVLDKKIKYEHYLNCIANKEFTVVEKQNCIRSKKHEVFSTTVQKVALSSKDKKRYQLGCNIKTLPWGHYKIPK